MMRKARRADVPAMAEFLVDRFWQTEHFVFLREGMQAPREVLLRMTRREMTFYCTQHEVWLYDDHMSGLLGVDGPESENPLAQLICAGQVGWDVLHLPTHDRRLLLARNRRIAQIHAVNWHRKYTEKAYHISQLAVARQAKGTGACRALIQPVLDRAKEQGVDVVLETFTQDNVALYEHFGFVLTETHTSPQMPYAEYCMIYHSGSPRAKT